MAGPSLPESITAGVTTGHVTDHEKIHDLLNELDTTDQASTKGDLLVVSGGTVKRLPVGTDDQVLTADAAEAAGVKWAIPSGGGGGGGGDSFLADPNLKPPDSAHGSDIEFQTLGNGTSVATAGLTWLNQGSRTASVKGGRLTATVPAAVSDYGGLVVAAPASGVFTFAVRYRAWPTENYNGAGLLFVDDSPAGTFGTYRYSTRGILDGNIYLTSVSNAWGFSSNPASISAREMKGAEVYEQFEWTGTGTGTGTLVWKVSPDPLAGWITRYTTGTIARPTYVGVTLTGESSPNRDLVASFDFFRFDWTPDYDPTS